MLPVLILQISIKNLELTQLTNHFLKVGPVLIYSIFNIYYMLLKYSLLKYFFFSSFYILLLSVIFDFKKITKMFGILNYL